MSERPPPHDEGPDPDQTGELRIPPPSPDPEPPPGEPVGYEPSGDEPAEAAPMPLPAEEPPAPACAVCASPLDADQTYCLQCGEPTPLAPVLRRRRRTVGLAVAALVVLGLGAGALAYAVAEDDKEPGPATSTVPTSGIVTVPTTTVPVLPPTGTLPPDTSVAPATVPTVPTGLPTAPTVPTVLPTTPTVPTVPTTPTVPTIPTTPTVPTVATTPTVPTEPPPAPVPPTTPPPTGTFQSDWPAGASGWTAVLSSVRDVDEAVGTRDRIQSSGEPAGVLLSGDYQDLRRGYYVVFSGVFDTKADALAQIARLEAEHPDAYPARIVPR